MRCGPLPATLVALFAVPLVESLTNFLLSFRVTPSPLSHSLSIAFTIKDIIFSYICFSAILALAGLRHKKLHRLESSTIFAFSHVEIILPPHGTNKKNIRLY